MSRWHPFLVIKIYNKETVLILPLTSRLKIGKYYSTVKLADRNSSVVLSQSRTISTRRLSRKICRIPIDNFNEIKLRFIETI